MIKEGMSSIPAIVWAANERTRGMSKLTEAVSEEIRSLAMCQQTYLPSAVGADKPGWEKMVAVIYVQHLPFPVTAPYKTALLGAVSS